MPRRIAGFWQDVHIVAPHEHFERFVVGLACTHTPLRPLAIPARAHDTHYLSR